MLPHSLVTVQATLKAPHAIHLVCTVYVIVHPFVMLIFNTCLLHSWTVCNPVCICGTCNDSTFTCDCADNFEGPDCSTSSVFILHG